MPITQYPTRIEYDVGNKVYNLKTVEGSDLVIAFHVSKGVPLTTAKDPNFVADLYSKEIISAEKDGSKYIFVLALAQDHAELIRNAHPNPKKGEAEDALTTFLSNYKENSWLLADNSLFYVLDKEGFDGVIVVDRALLDNLYIKLPRGYKIEDILKAETTEMFESSQGRVLVPKGFSGVRVVEGYGFKIGQQSLYDFEINPLVVAACNGHERARAVARFVADKNYFRENPYVRALTPFTVKKEGSTFKFDDGSVRVDSGSLVKRVLAFEGDYFGSNGFYFRADGIIRDLYNVRGVRLKQEPLP